MRIFTAQGLPKPALFYTYAVSVSDSPGASVNDYSPTGYGPGTNRLLITPTAGGTTITGLNASGIKDGWSIALLNDSGTDNLLITDSDVLSLAANRFLVPGRGPASPTVILPGQGKIILRVGSNWRFTS